MKRIVAWSWMECVARGWSFSRPAVFPAAWQYRRSRNVAEPCATPLDPILAVARLPGLSGRPPETDAAGGVSPPGKTAGLEAPYPNDLMIVAVKDAEIPL